MNLTYEEYLNLIPEKTKQIVKKILQYIYYFEEQKQDLKITGREAIKRPKEIGITAAAYLGACSDSEINSKLKNKGFDSDRIHVSYNMSEISYEKEKEIFERHNNLFLNFKDESKYITQNPFNILRKALSLVTNSYEFESQLIALGLNDTVTRYVKEVDNNLVKEARIQLEEELYQGLPVAVIEHLETASKIREYYIKEFNSRNISENEYLKNDDSYLVPISLFLAILEKDSKEKEDLISYFESVGVTKEKIRTLIRVPSTSDYNKYEVNLECIKHLYKKFYTKQEFKTAYAKQKIYNVKVNNLNELIRKLLFRNNVGNMCIERILGKMNVQIEEFYDFENSVKTSAALRKEREEREYTKSFYANLSVETKEFINLATKIYQLILEKMQERNHNSGILSCEDDADTLALYIASSFYNTQIEQFYTGHGVTLDKVLKLLNLSITKEEVAKVKLNSRLTIDRFKRFVTGGVNSRKNADKVKVEDVARNLCNRDFNKSTLMENIFEEIRRDIDLPNDFSRTVDNYFVTTEKERIAELTNEFFKDKSNDYYDILEKTCIVYNAMKSLDSKNEHQDEELIPISFLYALLVLKKEDYELYESLGIDTNFIDKHYGNSIKSYMKNNTDIDTIISKLSPYIAEKDGKIKVKIFDEKSKNIALIRFLAKKDLTYETFSDMASLRTELDKKKIEEEKRKEAENLLSDLNNDSKKIIKDAIRIFEKLNLNKTDIIKEIPEQELVSLAMFLGLLKNHNNQECIKKYGISYGTVLDLLGYDSFDLADDYNYEFIRKNFIKYCKQSLNNSKKVTLEELCEKVFTEESKIIKGIIENFSVDFKVFKTEYIYGKEYLETLSIDERREYLASCQTPELEISNTTDIMLYGSNLGTHTKYINSEYPSLMSEARSNSDTKSIQEIVNQVYQKKQTQPQKQSWLGRLFSSPKETIEEYEIDGYALQKLKNKIAQQITPLYDDIRTFEGLAEYMEVYRKKNLEYLDKVNKAIEMFRKKYASIDENDIIQKFKFETYIKALEAKKESFIVTDQLIKNYIYSVYVLIQTDLVTITGLEMSRDTLIPLIGAGQLIDAGIQNQRVGINANKFVMSLLGNVVSKNNEGMKQNLEELRLLEVSDERLLQLTTDVNNYIAQITSARTKELPETQALPLQLPDEDSTGEKTYKKL